MTEPTEQEETIRLREIDYRVEVARGRSKTDLYQTATNDRTGGSHPEWYWTFSNNRGQVRPKPVPYYTRDMQAAFELLCQGIERFGGGGIRADMEEWEAGGLFIASFYAEDDKERRSTWLPFREAICEAYLAACAAEKGEGV